METNPQNQDLSIFSPMVANLVKSGDAIMASLTPVGVDLWHGATGVAGECGELLDAYLLSMRYDLAIDNENLIEELGDTEFYLEQVRTNRGLNRNDVIAKASLMDAGQFFHCETGEFFALLAVAGTDLLDVVKKAVVYNKPIPDEDFIERLAAIEIQLDHIREIYGITRDDTISANIFKLATGPNARYKHGYTDQAAQDRADKAA